MLPPCPLCSEYSSEFYTGKRVYLRCPGCGYVFLHPSERLESEAEKARYLLHNNNLDYPGYRRWLGNFLDFVLKFSPIASPASVLDFGSGPFPALAILLKERGFHVSIEDAFFAPERPMGPFQLVTALEVFEHLFNPLEALSSISQRMVPGGILAISTEFLPENNEDFSGWHYISDPTHVGFFTVDCLLSAASRFGFRPIADNGERYIVMGL